MSFLLLWGHLTHVLQWNKHNQSLSPTLSSCWRVQWAPPAEWLQRDPLSLAHSEQDLQVLASAAWSAPETMEENPSSWGGGGERKKVHIHLNIMWCGHLWLVYVQLEYPWTLYLYRLLSRLSFCRAPSLANHLWLRLLSSLSDRSSSSRLHRGSNADGRIQTNLLPGGQ